MRKGNKSVASVRQALARGFNRGYRRIRTAPRPTTTARR